MSIELNLHNIVKVHASSGNGTHAYWVDIFLTDKKGNKQEITIFCDTMVLAGIIAKALNEAQEEYEKSKTRRQE